MTFLPPPLAFVAKHVAASTAVGEIGPGSREFGRARGEAKQQAAQEKRAAAKDRRPAPGDAVDDSSTRGRG